MNPTDGPETEHYSFDYCGVTWDIRVICSWDIVTDKFVARSFVSAPKFAEASAHDEPFRDSQSIHAKGYALKQAKAFIRSHADDGRVHP